MGLDQAYIGLSWASAGFSRIFFSLVVTDLHVFRENFSWPPMGVEGSSAGYHVLLHVFHPGTTGSPVVVHRRPRELMSVPWL